ncbi:acyl carrier protein [Streptomyces sp. NPDC097619]|uniref:acyl carrier protein n=1 Tax=Streptomyces sp. NPDC097619 TaxID=3157228 RepID=UPI00331C1BB6
MSRPAETHPESGADEHAGTAPEAGAHASEALGAAELTPRILAAFERRLDSPGLGPDEDFFEQGGSSFTAALVTADLRKQGIALSIQDIFVAPTPQGLALRIQPLQKAL